MKKQNIRFYAALLCSSMVFSLVSTPVSAAETEQMLNPPTSTEELSSPESISGNEAAAALNGLSVLAANGEAEVTTASELTGALADSSISGITLKGDIDIGSTLTVNRTVTLDLNGNVLKMTGRGSSDYAHNDGGGVLVNAGGILTMTGGSIVGCSAIGLGGGVRLAYDSAIGKNSTFTMTGGSIIGCAAKNGGGVSISPGCTFTMGSGSEIRNCNAQSGGGGVGISALWNSNIIGRFIMNGGTIRTCTGLYSGGVDNSGSFIMSGGTIKASISTTTQYASSGGVRNDNQFTMTGGTIGDPTNPNDASSVYNTSSQRVILTICDNAKIYTNVTNVGILNADGGEIAGTMTNDTNEYGSGTITGSAGAAGSTEFHGKVTNTGTILKGTFTNEVINESSGTINGGTFTGTVENKGGTISGGDFSGTTLPVKLMITFEPNNGEPVITREVNWSKDGAALTAPASTNEGHSLDGWYYDNNGMETKWNFDTDTVKCTMTLKAKWELSTYSVTLQTDGGTIASGKEVTGYTYGTGAVLPTAADITREGYRFDGWYADSSFSGSPITEISATETGNKTFYAKWTKNTTPIIPGSDTNNIVEQYKTDDSGSGEQTDLDVPTPVVKNTTSYLTYTVQAGDTLWKIARKYSCSVAEIVAANSDRIKNPNRIHAGWQLKIPQSGAPITGGAPDAVLPENKKSGMYIVRQGDTLWAIARKCGCSVAEIVSLNRELIRNPALIYSGWELKVPQD